MYGDINVCIIQVLFAPLPAPMGGATAKAPTVNAIVNRTATQNAKWVNMIQKNLYVDACYETETCVNILSNGTVVLILRTNYIFNWKNT